MGYNKQKWKDYDINVSFEQNISEGAVASADKMNHMEDGIYQANLPFTVKDVFMVETEEEADVQIDENKNISFYIPKGKTGQSAFEFWNELNGNENKTKKDFEESLKGNKIHYGTSIIKDEEGVTGNEEVDCLVGDIYINTTTLDMFKCIENTETSTTWEYITSLPTFKVKEIDLDTFRVYSGKKEGTELGEGATASGYNVTATGAYSQASGYETVAEGDFSIAGGYKAKATGFGSVALGISATSRSKDMKDDEVYEIPEGALYENSKAITVDCTSAEGIGSFALGYLNSAKGDYSFAVGQENVIGRDAGARYGFACGAKNYVQAAGGAAFGYNNQSLNHQSVAFGADNKVFGINSLAMGSKLDHRSNVGSLVIGESNVSYNGNSSYVEGKGNCLSNERASEIGYCHYTHIEGLKNTTKGTQASHVEGTENTLNEGTSYSHMEGSKNTAINSTTSHIEGSENSLNGADYAHIEGCNNISTAKYSHTEGNGTKTIGLASHAEGTNIKSIEEDGTIIREDPKTFRNEWVFWTGKHEVTIDATTAMGKYSHAEGVMTLAYGLNSHAEGYGTCAGGEYSHAEGGSCSATCGYAHVEGLGNIASGSASHCEGRNNRARGNWSHAEGCYTYANGWCSHATGSYSTANGKWAYVGGTGCTSNGPTAFSTGFSNVANGNQFVIGKYNMALPGQVNEDDSKGYFLDNNLFIIGNGYKDFTNNKVNNSNAFRVTTVGNVYSGTFNSRGTNYAEMFEWSDANPEGEDRRGLFVTVENDKIRLATPEDEYIAGIITTNSALVGDIYFNDISAPIYKRDIFGKYLSEVVETTETYQLFSEETQQYEDITENLKVNSLVMNDEPVTQNEVVNRETSQSWAAVALVGKVIVVDDGSCQPNGYCTVSANSKATNSASKEDLNRFRVLNRIDDTHITVLLK